MKERRGDCRSVTFVLATIVGSKNKSIYLRDFKDVDFIFAHFANFKFAYFDIEVSFWSIWLNLQNGSFQLQISILGTERCSFPVKALFLLILCINEILTKFG